MDEFDLSGIEYLNMVDHPEGRLVEGGKIRLLGFSEPPAAPQSAPHVTSCDGPMLVNLELRKVIDEASGVERLEPRRYSWCSCGYSRNQPFCDNQHREEENATNRKSYKFEVLEPCTVELCMCRHTKNPPFCDGSHEGLCARLSAEGRLPVPLPPKQPAE